MEQQSEVRCKKCGTKKVLKSHHKTDRGDYKILRCPVCLAAYQAKYRLRRANERLPEFKRKPHPFGFNAVDLMQSMNGIDREINVLSKRNAKTGIYHSTNIVSKIQKLQKIKNDLAKLVGDL